ncbi:hypothetical protein MPSI1_003791 [Malassezia psittaci]|uniref:Uncharacterized protein n=1 Tax=Malassezia psittaci TaxID=1821823 RepID=A0AAF0FE82_9BASI|nr:hypothetical protein MPSI1_003791 [Malassezia psittaci]
MEADAGERCKQGSVLGKRRNRSWWGMEHAEESDLDDDADDVNGSTLTSSLVDDLSRRSSSPMPDSLPPQHKRRHIEGEIGPPLDDMSLNEPTCTVEEPDTEMATGGSYDISPYRVYVHSLDDSDDDQEETEKVPYSVHPYVSGQLSSASMPRKESIPKWLATAQDEAMAKDLANNQSLVLYQAPIWQEEQSQPTETLQDEPMMDL